LSKYNAPWFIVWLFCSHFPLFSFVIVTTICHPFKKLSTRRNGKYTHASLSNTTSIITKNSNLLSCLCFYLFVIKKDPLSFNIPFVKWTPTKQWLKVCHNSFSENKKQKINK
jgi:hypothetical protein